jgi:aspartate-semialdehyde dehydrogenase
VRFHLCNSWVKFQWNGLGPLLLSVGPAKMHSMDKKYRVAVVGATGAVGREMLRMLWERKFPAASVRALASSRSSGQSLPYGTGSIVIEALNPASAKNVDVALFSAGGDISKEYASIFLKEGAVVVDNSSAFRMDPEVPLVIPEVNPEALSSKKRLIANPNCSTIIAITPLWPIHQKNRIRRLIASTYQAASGAGAAAMDELMEGTKAHVEGREFKPSIFPHPYAFNLFSHNSKIDPKTGYNQEEIKMVEETRKIFNDADIRISATCVRVPVPRAHSEALNFECERAITPDEVRAILKNAPGVKIVDDMEKNYFPMPKDASGQGDILIGRIRQDSSDPSGKSIVVFVSGDQLLKGAALNAVQIAELMAAKDLI